MKTNLYQPSGKTSTQGQIAFYAIALFFFPFLGYLYGMLTYYMPIPYINGLVTVGAGLALAAMNVYLMILFKNRSKKNLIIGTLVSTFSFFVSAWITYLIIGVFGPFEYWMMPSAMGNILKNYGLGNVFGVIYEYGLHTIFGFPLNGIALLMTWIIEAGIIYTTPIVAAYKHVLPPFSERQNKHYKKEVILNHFGRVHSENILIENLDKSVLETLENLTKSSSMKGFSKITLHTLPNESENYISVSNVFYDSKNRKSTDLILRYYRVDLNTIEKIKEKFHTKKVLL